MLDTATRARGTEIAFEDRLLTVPAIEPLDLEEIKKQRRFSSTSLDTLFDLWNSAARQQFEEMTGLQLITAQRVFLLDAMPADSVIMFSRGPVQSVDAFAYLDDDDVEQTFTDFEKLPIVSAVDTYPEPGGVQLAVGGTWPTVTERSQAIRIRYTAGYGDAPGAVPELIRYALLQYIGAFHKYGEDVGEAELYCLPVGAQMVIREAKGRMLRTVVPRRL